MQSRSLLLWFTTSIAMVSAATSSFDDVAEELESTFGCDDNSIMAVLNGTDSEACEEFSYMNNALDNTDDDEDDALLAVLLELLSPCQWTLLDYCDDDTTIETDMEGYCADEDVQEALLDVNDGEYVVEGDVLYSFAAGTFCNQYSTSTDFEWKIDDTSEYDIFGCSIYSLTADPGKEGAFSSYVDRSDESCIASILAQVVSAREYYEDEYGSDDSDDDDSDDSLKYIVYAFAGILGFGLVGVCCLALSSSQMSPPEKKKKKKTKKSRSKKKSTV